MRILQIKLALLLLLLCGLAVSAQQRPLLTEDVDIIPPGSLRIEAGIDFVQNAKFPVSGLTGDLTRVGVIGGVSSRLMDYERFLKRRATAEARSSTVTVRGAGRLP